MTVDPQISRILVLIGAGELLFVDEAAAEAEIPGITRAVSLGLVEKDEGAGWSVGPSYRLSSRGREQIGLPPTFSLRRWLGALVGRAG